MSPYNIYLGEEIRKLAMKTVPFFCSVRRYPISVASTSITPDKVIFFQPKSIIFFLFL